MTLKIKKLALFIYCIIAINSLCAQVQQPAQNDLDFVVNKIKYTYVGYDKNIHEADIDKIISEIKKSTSIDTFSNLSKLTLYFNDCHLTLFERYKNKLKNIDTNNCNNNIKMLSSIQNKKYNKNQNEGYWINEENSAIIYLKQKSKKIMAGFIIESKNNTPKGFFNLKLNTDSKYGLVGDFIDIDYGFRVITKSYFKNKKVLLIGSHSRWSKIDNYYAGMLKDKIRTDLRPAINIIDTNTIVFNMKDFSSVGRKVYDSVVNANVSIIEKAKTLIIDARNNAGGGYSRMYPILPYICTKPIITCDANVMCSQDLIDDAKINLDKLVMQKDTSRIEGYRNYLDSLLAYKNSLRYIKGRSIEYDSKPNKIQNVAVLYSATTRSAGELMIMYLKQSDKVTTFGERSGGVVDNLDMLTYKTPSSKYSLWVAYTKRIPTKANPLYDKTGIKPDIEISDDEPDWINFVKKYYEKN
jgi:Peptidase family S41